MSILRLEYILIDDIFEEFGDHLLALADSIFCDVNRNSFREAI